MEHPNSDDYCKLLALYDKDFDLSLLSNNKHDYSFLFNKIMQMLLQPSDFNQQLPLPLRSVVQEYAAGNPAMREHLDYNENRQFFLADVYNTVLMYQRNQHRAGIALERMKENNQGQA